MKRIFKSSNVQAAKKSLNTHSMTTVSQLLALSVALFALYLLAPATQLHAQSCWAAWSSTAVYTGGAQVSYNGENYQADYWTQGNNPSTSSGPVGSGQPWIPEGSCGSGGGSGITAPQAPTQCGLMTAGQGLLPGQSVSSCDSRFTLIMQTDSNLVLYMGTSALWASNTVGDNNAEVIMQSDGNLVTYNSSGGATWAAGTWGNPGAYLAVQTDGNLVIYNSSNSPLWASNTCCHPASGGGGGSTGKLFAPYIDMSTATAESLATVMQQSGIKLFSAAFIVGSGCTPQWGGMYVGLTGNMNNGQSYPSNIAALRAAGGDIIMSNGGQAQPELADSCLNVSETQAAYQAEVSTFSLKYIDFDIETSQAGVNVRSQAVAALEAANPGLVVSVTLPVLPTGLVQNGLNVINSANAYGMHINTVNVMAMDYGSSVDGLSSGATMGGDAEAAAEATHNQTGMNIGITPEIGVNDTSTEVFQLSDAQNLLNWANGQSYVNRLGYWSVTRDNGGCAGAGYASPTCSGISQSTYQFASIFESF